MIKLIAAISKNRQIGISGKMPWHIPEDLEYFKRMTTGHTILMGRKTFESIGKALPNRRNIVLTHNLSYTSDGIETIHSLDEAFALCKECKDLFIIGGGELYRAFLPFADELYLTLVDKTVVGDTAFPDFEADFKCIERTLSHTQSSTGIDFTFTHWIRKKKLAYPLF